MEFVGGGGSQQGPRLRVQMTVTVTMKTASSMDLLLVDSSGQWCWWTKVMNLNLNNGNFYQGKKDLYCVTRNSSLDIRPLSGQVAIPSATLRLLRQGKRGPQESSGVLLLPRLAGQSTVHSLWPSHALVLPLAFSGEDQFPPPFHVCDWHWAPRRRILWRAIFFHQDLTLIHH